MQQIKWKVSGMDCNTCALHIHKYLEKQGMQQVKVNFANGDVWFVAQEGFSEEPIKKGIANLGYEVTDQKSSQEARAKTTTSFFSLATHQQRLLFCLPFALVMLAGHLLPHSVTLFHHPWFQLGVTLPVFALGLHFFGRSAFKSIRAGMPNMNVLITLGATAAFIYSLYGSLTGQPEQYLFYETTTTIITLVLLGNYLEERSIASTQRALEQLVQAQKLMATMIAFDDQHHEQYFTVENTLLKVGDLILIKAGEQVPIDCKILWGEAHVNESIITGESLPVHKHPKDALIGGSIFQDGTVKAQVTAVGDDTVLSGIIQLVRGAQGEKPPMQLLADKISAVFIPLVLAIALLTGIINYIVLNDLEASLLRSIAVLVIACPCAMGLATPAAIAVGLGRAARNGILFSNARSLELFRQIRQVVFDKTGTLTTGSFRVSDWQLLDDGISAERFRALVYSLEKFSNHPIALCLTKEFKTNFDMRWRQIEEIKGRGIFATDPDGISYSVGSYHTVKHTLVSDHHQVYVCKGGELIGWIDLEDEVRPEAKEVIDYLHQKNIKTILLSGDNLARCQAIGSRLGIDRIYGERSPEEKMDIVAALTQQAPTAMVGDGINDAPALAKATVGIAMSQASQLAMQSAQVILLNGGLNKLPEALGLGRHTYLTIQQNLFWAFAYNVVAIPVAALGFLTPTFGALVMAFSDVVLAVNSVRLFVKRVR
ncbi:MAG: heavy metal translocating P-type ATPase [Sphingomonadales bacterium]